MHKIIIIGAGPAGMACALQLKRYNIDALLIEANKPGGLLHNANKVENYLGFQGIKGTDLIKHFTTHLQQNDIKITQDLVRSVRHPATQSVDRGIQKNRELTLDPAVKPRDDEVQKNFEIQGTNQTYYCEKLILATGTIPKKTDMIDERIFYEPIDVKNKNIVIVGAGDAAFDYAINMAQHNQVIILNRGIEIKALPVLQKIVAENSKINYIENARIDDYADKADFIIFAIGRIPNKPEMVVDEEELIKQQKLFLIGDIKNGIYRQTSLAVADGIKAAMEIALGNKQ